MWSCEKDFEQYTEGSVEEPVGKEWKEKWHLLIIYQYIYSSYSYKASHELGYFGGNRDRFSLKQKRNSCKQKSGRIQYREGTGSTTALASSTQEQVESYQDPAVGTTAPPSIAAVNTGVQALAAYLRSHTQPGAQSTEDDLDLLPHQDSKQCWRGLSFGNQKAEKKAQRYHLVYTGINWIPIVNPQSNPPSMYYWLHFADGETEA